MKAQLVLQKIKDRVSLLQSVLIAKLFKELDLNILKWSIFILWTIIFTACPNSYFPLTKPSFFTICLHLLFWSFADIHRLGQSLLGESQKQAHHQ